MADLSYAAQFGLKSARCSLTVAADGSFAISQQISRNGLASYPGEHRLNLHHSDRAGFMERPRKLGTFRLGHAPPGLSFALQVLGICRRGTGLRRGRADDPWIIFQSRCAFDARDYARSSGGGLE